MKHPVKWLIALNILTLFITLVMFGVGFAANTMTYKMERDLLNTSVTEVSAKMEKRIGKSYTAGLHESVITFMESGERVMVSSVETMRSFTTAIFQTGAWIFLISLVNLFLLWKTKRVHDAATSVSR
ncbi:MAG: hypothetical protein KF712_11400 [Akkermansiaceae bacterium]|nr:hypothetical protein [Akkermansiaceae bacterium]